MDGYRIYPIISFILFFILFFLFIYLFFEVINFWFLYKYYKQN